MVYRMTDKRNLINNYCNKTDMNFKQFSLLVFDQSFISYLQ